MSNPNDSILKKVYDYVLDAYYTTSDNDWRDKTNDEYNKYGLVYTDLFYLSVDWIPPPQPPPVGTLGSRPDDQIKTGIDNYTYQIHADNLVNYYILDPTPWYAPYLPDHTFEPGGFLVPGSATPDKGRGIAGSTSGWWHPEATPVLSERRLKRPRAAVRAQSLVVCVSSVVDNLLICSSDQSRHLSLIL